MKRKRRSVVDIQTPSEICGDSGSYERFAEEGGESVLGNPDLLPSQDTSASTPQLIMGEAIQHLQGRQREVYLLIMREELSQYECAEALDITRTSVQNYLDRAIAFITAYCKQAEQNGRV